MEKLKDAVGIECDLDRGKILTVEDLDCLCTLEGLDRSPKRFQEVREILNLDLPQEDVNHIAIKMAAKWSLGGIARREKLILDTCEEEVAKREGPSRLSLLEILAEAYLWRTDNKNAVDNFQAYLQLNPANSRIKEKLQSLKTQPEGIKDASEAGDPVKIHAEVPDGLPPKALITGVPFIGVEEAMRWDYPDNEIVHPSSPASMGMILSYWGMDPTQMFEEEEEPEIEFENEGGQGNSLHVLKPFIVRGIPILIGPMALTPYAHPVIHMGAEMTGNEFENRGPFSGALGRMLPLDEFNESSLPKLPGVTMMESVFMSNRVVIGYDDDREILILHDPTFGPAWEVRYDDFEAMWEPTDRNFSVPIPHNHQEIISDRSSAISYSERLPDDEAAVQFVFGYASSSSGRVEEAEVHLRKGLATPGIGKGFQFLFLNELAVHYAATGRTDEAIVAAEKASNLFPKQHATWHLLARLYKRKCPNYRKPGGLLKFVYKIMLTGRMERNILIANWKAKIYRPVEGTQMKVDDGLPGRFDYDDFLYGFYGAKLIWSD